MPQTLILAGEDYVVIRRDEYERLRAAADEDAADVAAIRRVLDDPDETWAPADLVRRIVEGEHPVRVWRTHRGLTARALATAAGIPSSYLSAIERGVKPGSVKALKESRHRPRRATGRSRVTAAPWPRTSSSAPPRQGSLLPSIPSAKPSCRLPRTSRGSPSDGSTDG